MVLTRKEYIFLVENLFLECGIYIDFMLQRFADEILDTPVQHCNAVYKLVDKCWEQDTWTMPYIRKGYRSSKKRNCYFFQYATKSMKIFTKANE